jgi:CheY-like chemotaxis protein
LHQELKKKSQNLQILLTTVQNYYPNLYDNVKYYQEIVNRDISVIDDALLWSAGVSLMAISESFSRIGHGKDDHREPLSVDQMALLSEVATLHGAFVLGLPNGRSLTEKADISKIPLLPEIGSTALNILENIKDGNLSDNETKKLISAALNAVRISSWNAARSGYLIYSILRNSLVAIGKTVIKINSMPSSIAGTTSAALIASANGWDINTAKTTIAFIMENSGSILQFSVPFPEFRSYVRYLISLVEKDSFEFGKNVISTQVIFIIDDDVDILNYMNRTLKKAGYQCICETEPEILIDKITSADFFCRLLIVDTGLPVIHGMELIRKIAKKMGIIPPLLILETGVIETDYFKYNVSHTMHDLSLTRGTDYEIIDKPFGATQLIEAVEKIIF